MTNKLVNWQEINKILSTLGEGFVYSLDIDFTSYWKNPPDNSNEQINRSVINAHIKHAIERFLEKKENQTMLMELILRNDNGGNFIVESEDKPVLP
jgi:hypothetical protein